jgi:cytochrome c
MHHPKLKKFFPHALAVMAAILFICPLQGMAEEPVKILKSKVEKASQFLSENGKAGLSEFMGQDNQWKAKPYIFVYDLSGTIIGHPANPKLVGKNLMGLKDIKGNMFAAEFVTIAKDKGKGWSEYWWPKPGEKTASLKASYIMRVPGQDMLVGAGVYDISKKDAIAIAGE